MTSPLQEAGSDVCINDCLRDDELRVVLGKLLGDKEVEVFGLVCKRWLNLQSTERRKLCARAGPHMLRKMAARFTRLHELDLSQSVSRSFYPGVTDSDLFVIASSFTCLRVLTLQNCKSITDTGVEAIACGLPCLQVLDVSYCRKLTDKGISAVAKGCSELRSLLLAGCRFVTDALLQELSENCHCLEELCLQGCNSITDAGLTGLAKGCQKIKHLDTNKCSNISDVGITSISEACSCSLKTLKLLDCYKVGDESVFALARSCMNLETLVVGGCRDISDDSIKSLASCCSQSLKNLRMDWCQNVSDSSLNCILTECRNLEALDIGCCEEVTDNAFVGLGNNPVELSLKVLKISNCPRITVTGVGLLLEACKSLEYLDARSCPHITKPLCDAAGLKFPDLCKVNFNGSLLEPDVLL